MRVRVRHYYHGIGTIREERGAETLVAFDNGEILWVYTMTLIPLDDKSLHAPETNAYPLLDSENMDTHDPDAPTGDHNTDKPFSAGERTDTKENTPQSLRTEEVASSIGRKERAPQMMEIRANEKYLTIIALIIGIIFISALIIATTPPAEPPEEISLPIASANSTAQPAVWSMLHDYFGRSVIVINTTPKMPTEEPVVNESESVQYDDELFVSTISTGAVPLTIISMHTIIAIDQSNAQILAQNNERLHAIAYENFEKVGKMRVSDEHTERKEDFQHAMLEFISASSYLRRGLPSSDSERREALNILATATERLDAALRDIGLDIESLAERDLYPVELSRLSAPAKPDNLLALGTPFIYRDTTRSNEISIYPRYARRQTTLWYDASTGTEHLTAGDGKTFMVVLIQATHRGNLDGQRYTIQTPQPDAFTLHGGGETFTPVETPAHTSLGEMYRTVTLNRKESRQSFILFEVPYSLSPFDAHLSINLGSTWGTPAWDLKE